MQVKTHGERTAAEQRPLVGCLVSLTVMLTLFTGGVYLVARPAMPRRLLRQLVPGMTKAEVRSVLGAPQEGGSDDNQWTYWRRGNPGWVEVDFKEDGTFRSINDESAFP